MRDYLRRSVQATLHELFPQDDAETALAWWIATEGRPPVAVVGAGFTRNAVDRTTGKLVAPGLVPLWQEVLRHLGDDLRASPDGIDALSFAELHQEGLGSRRHLDALLRLLPDERLELGAAHKAPVVATWREAARERTLKLRKLTFEDVRGAERRRAFQSMSMRFSDAPYLVWRSFRDVEELHAHPIVQRDQLLPLLDHGLGDVAQEVKYRLAFDVDAFSEWSQQSIEDTVGDGRVAYDERTAAVVTVSWRTPGTLPGMT